MPAIANLEVEIGGSGPGTYAVSVRHSSEVSNTYQIDITPGEDDVSFNPEAFRERTERARLGIDTKEYGQALWDTFFAGKVEERLMQAVSSIVTPDRIRMRLYLKPSALELHDLIWETLPDPTSPAMLTGQTLATSERILFSRYITSQEWQRIQLRRRKQMRALVVVANPNNLATFQDGSTNEPLAPVDVAGEVARAREGLRACGADVTILAHHADAAGTPTFDNLVSHLTQHEGYDILYLACHGQRVENQPMLWLEAHDGTADVVSGSRLVKATWRLEYQPLLIVLASCMSAGPSDEPALADRGSMAAIGPMLASIGVPAVLAMQGAITMESLETFIPVFFESLEKTGQVDRAVAAAREAISGRRDAWMPVLFMRTHSGEVWYEPRFVSRTHGGSTIAWDTLLQNICEQKCTVILGSGLLEGIIGSPRSMAQKWATNRKFPVDHSEMDDLPQIAQYIAAQEGDLGLRSSLREWLLQEMRARFREKIPGQLGALRVSEVMRPIGQYLRDTEELEPHRVLARLPFPIYITTNPDSLLIDALKEVNRTECQQEFFHWREDRTFGNGQHDPGQYNDELDIEPTWDQPLVYHLFGHFEDPESILLSEDNYFDYLIGATSNRQSMPTAVRLALTDRFLLFLGFQMTDWDFRVLLRIIVNQVGGRNRNFPHVAVQVHPEDDRVQDPEWVRRFLENYLRGADLGKNPSVFWGDSTDFLRELNERWIQRYSAFPTFPFNFDGSDVCTCDPRTGKVEAW